MARICILGGTGFIGQVLATQLTACGHQIRIPTRHRNRHRHLLVLPTLELVQTDILQNHALGECLDGTEVLINLVGILNESRRQRFKTMHIELAQRLAALCQSQRIPRFLHMSALGACSDSSSQYLSSKGQAEMIVHKFSGHTAVTSFRPSVVFGPNDQFIQRFTRLLRIAPYYFPLACPEARFAPVYVDDLVGRMIDSLDDPTHFGQSIELCGPDAYSLKQLVQLIAHAQGLNRRLIELSPWQSRLQARLLSRMPGKPFTLDNYHSLQTDSVCAQPSSCPTHLESVLHTLSAAHPGPR